MFETIVSGTKIVHTIYSFDWWCVHETDILCWCLGTLFLEEGESETDGPSGCLGDGWNKVQMRRDWQSVIVWQKDEEEQFVSEQTETIWGELWGPKNELKVWGKQFEGVLMDTVEMEHLGLIGR